MLASKDGARGELPFGRPRIQGGLPPILPVRLRSTWARSSFRVEMMMMIH